MKRFLGLGICLVYGLLFLAITWPLCGQFTTAVLGSGPDPYQYIWNADVFRSELLNGSNPFFTDRLLYPKGVNLWMHTYTPVIGLFNVIADNPYLSVNLVLLLSVMLGGYGAYLLARDYLKSRWLAFACGFVFAFSPYITSHLLEHMHLILIAGVPYFTRALLHLFPHKQLELKRIQWRQLLWMGLCFIITFFSDYYTSFFLIFLTAFYLLYLIIQPVLVQWKTWHKITAVIVLFLAGHLAVEPLYQNGQDNRGAFYNTADLASVIVPAENSLLYSHNVFEQWRNELQYKGPNEQVMFFGFGLILLFLVFLFQAKTQRFTVLLYLVIIFFLLSLPKLKLWGNSVTYSPFAWFHYVSFFNNIRNPTRMVQMVYLFLPILAFSPLDKAYVKGKLRYLLVLPVLFIIVEFLPKKFAMISKEAVPAYASVIAEEQAAVVWNIPTGIQDGFKAVGSFDSKLLQHQLVHKKKILGAYVSRLPQERFVEWQNEPVLNLLTQVQDTGIHQLRSVEELVQMGTLNPLLIQSFIKRHQLDLIVVDLAHKRAKEALIVVHLNFESFIVQAKRVGDYQLFYLGSAE